MLKSPLKTSLMQTAASEDIAAATVLKHVISYCLEYML